MLPGCFSAKEDDESITHSVSMVCIPSKHDNLSQCWLNVGLRLRETSLSGRKYKLSKGQLIDSPGAEVIGCGPCVTPY